MLPISYKITNMELKNLSFPILNKKKLSHYNHSYDTYKYKLRDKKYNIVEFDPLKSYGHLFFNDILEYWYQDKMCKYRIGISSSSSFKPKIKAYSQRIYKIYLREFRKKGE